MHALLLKHCNAYPNETYMVFVCVLKVNHHRKRNQDRQETHGINLCNRNISVSLKMIKHSVLKLNDNSVLAQVETRNLQVI